MAIAFNLPSEREATEENFSRLNRLLAELYEVLCHILVARQSGQEGHENRRDRPFSDSDIERPATAVQVQAQQCRISASSPPLAFNSDQDLDDDVFVSPRTDNGNDPFSTRHLDIFGNGIHRTPAGVLLSPRRERKFTFSLTSEKHWLDKGGTDVADGVNGELDETDAVEENESQQPQTNSPAERFTLLSMIPVKISGSICTAVLLMLGWKLLSHKG